MGGMSTCWVLTSRTPRTERATSTASSIAAVPSSVTSPLLASTVMRSLRVSVLVASWGRLELRPLERTGDELHGGVDRQFLRVEHDVVEGGIAQVHLVQVAH